MDCFMNFSVIIPLYNKADTVERAIRSVLRQTCQNFEIIVVDDESLDNGAEIVEQICDQRIRLIRQENGGVSAARNTGISNAKYDFVTFLDADDEYLSDYLETLDHLIQCYPDTAIWGTCYTFQLPDGLKVAPKINGIPADFEGYLSNYFEIASKSSPPIWTGAVCIRKAALQKIGGFPVGIRSGEDLLTWAKLCAKSSPAYIFKQCSLYYIDVQEEQHRKPKRVPDFPDVVGNEFSTLYRNYPTKAFAKYCSLWHKMRASCFLRLSGYRWEALKETLKGLYWNPVSPKLYLYLFATLLPASLNRLFFIFLRKHSG